MACALLAFLLVDEYLYGLSGFARWTGQATQEGQILSKVARAPALAANADIILFGSSYTRSGVSGEPFWNHRLLPFNFGISGGGPLTSYFALKRIEDVLARRSIKPWLVIEIKLEAIERADDTLWAEYPQYLGIVRTRSERLAEASMLVRHFHEYGMLSPFVSSVVVPSSLYRSHNVQLMVRPHALDGYFYGAEDASGFSPLNGFARPGQFRTASRSRPRDLDAFVPEKIEEIRRFLDMARRLGCPVALYSSPSPYAGRDDVVYDTLYASLRKSEPDITVLRTSDYALEPSDFDEGGHPNHRGSAKLAERLIDTLSLRRDQRAFDERIHAAYEVMDVPPATAWQLARGARPEAAAAIALDGGATDPQVALLPPLTVVPGREYVIEARAELDAGELFVTAAWNRQGTGQRTERDAATLPPAFDGGRSRILLRVVPRDSRLTVAIIDHARVLGRGATRGRVEILRVWGDRG